MRPFMNLIHQEKRLTDIPDLPVMNGSLEQYETKYTVTKDVCTMDFDEINVLQRRMMYQDIHDFL